MLYEIIQRLMNSNTIINPNEVCSFIYWELVYKNELSAIKYNEKNMHINCYKYYLYSFISSLYYIPIKINIRNEIQKPIKTKTQKHRYKNNYTQLQLILNNMFINENIKFQIFQIWVKTIKTRNAFKLLLKLYKYKKSKLQINTDLCLNPIDPNHKNAMMIYHDGSKYLFVLSDLINHIETAICNCNWWFAEPLTCKNPYNNLPFSKSILYNIYFRIRESGYLMPVLIHNYFLCDFNLKIFLLENEYLIRDTYIKRFVKTSSSITLLPDIFDLLCSNHFDIEDDDYSKEKDEFVEIMRPYLYLYYISKHSVYGTAKRMISQNLLDYKLNELYLYNPKFGIKIMKRSEKGFVKSINIDHKKFTMNDIMNYYKNPNKYNITNNHVRFNPNATQSLNQTETEIIDPIFLRQLTTTIFDENQSIYNNIVSNQDDVEIELSREIVRETLRNIIGPVTENTNAHAYTSVTNNNQQIYVDNIEEEPRAPIIMHPINQTYTYNSRIQSRWTNLLSHINNLNNASSNNEFVYQFTINIDANNQELRQELVRELEEGEINEDDEEEINETPETGSIS